MHANLVAEPIDRLAARSHVIAVAEFVFVGDGVDDRIETVDIGADAYGFPFDARINFRNGFDLRIDRLRVAVNFSEEVGERLNAELHPFAEVRVGKISELEIALGVESSLLLERRDGVIVEAGPGIFPAIEMRHPVGNVDVDAVDAGGGDLAHALHISFAPLGSVGTDPDILIALSDPEGGAAAEDGGLAGD